MSQEQLTEQQIEELKAEIDFFEEEKIESEAILELLEVGMNQCATAKPLLDAIKLIQGSNVMTDFLFDINTEGATEEEVAGLIDNFGKAVSGNMMEGFQKYKDYLSSIIENPDYALRVEYYTNIRHSLDKIMSLDLWDEYQKNYEAFEADNSNEAQLVRFFMEQLKRPQEKMRKHFEN